MMTFHPIAGSSKGGHVALIFLDKTATEVRRDRLWLARAQIFLAPITTNLDSHFQLLAMRMPTFADFSSHYKGNQTLRPATGSSNDR
jgi:hypothetical protein